LFGASDILRQGVQGISDLIAVPGLVNLDFADVKTIMLNKGYAHMGVGKSSGDTRAADAVKQAIHSPLLETCIEGAKSVLLNITGGVNLGIFEVNEAAELVSQSADPDANIIFGAVIDEKMQDEIRITVIATGFENAVTAKPAASKGEIPKGEKKTDPFGNLDDNILEIPAFLRRNKK
jgi:cell division protein FtsZ